MSKPSRVVAVGKVLPVGPQVVFDLLADPALHPVLDGSGSVRRTRDGNPERLSLGARFGMDMHIAVGYRITNVVVEFDEPSRIAWRHFAGHRWRWLLTPSSDGTLVRAEWDATLVPQLWPLLALAGFPARNRAAMKASLDRLGELVSRRSDETS